jgi:integrase/recombinase XerC
MNKGKKLPPEVLAVGEVELLLDACTNRDLGLRNRAIVFCFWRTAIRVGELVALKVHDVDFSAGTLRIRLGKGAKARTVAVDDECAEVLRKWLARREVLGVPSPLMFTTLSGESLSTNAVRELMKRLRRRAGLTKRVHPHGLRATWASVAARQIPLVDVQTILGHENLTTTSGYVKGLGGEAIDSARRIVWR